MNMVEVGKAMKVWSCFLEILKLVTSDTQYVLKPKPFAVPFFKNV